MAKSLKMEANKKKTKLKKGHNVPKFLFLIDKYDE